jgi:cellulose synthase/poly-beta-1,6-N-acetylglucosamine synthase-like glycosyltransferase
MLIIQLFFYIFFYNKLNRYIKKNTLPEPSKYPDLSVVICARNEGKNIEEHLPKVLNQNYPGNYEVVVVNDASEDDTELTLARLKEKNQHLYYTTIPYDKKFRHGKKLALTIGVKAAKYNHMVFTDADCQPTSEHWLKHMAKGFIDGKEIVLGYGAYQKQKGLINSWLRYDTFTIAIQYLSFALRGIPYMGVGRNMAYTKDLFYKHQGFKSHQHLLSGDDDLFIRDAATKNNTAIITHPHAQTTSVPSATFKEWRRQKSRHLTTSPHYKRKIKILLGLELFSRQLFWSLSIVSIFFSTFAVSVIVVIAIKLLLQLLVLKAIAKRFEQKDLWWRALIYDFILPIVTGFILLGGRRQAKRNKWT